MAYTQGTYTDVHDLLNKVRVFATAAGWSTDSWTLGSGTGSNSELYMNKGGRYFSSRAVISAAAGRWYQGTVQTIEYPYIDIWGNTGYNGGNTVDNQPGTSAAIGRPRTDWLFGPSVQYWMFTNATGDYIHVVAEPVPSEFQHFGFGDFDKIGSYTGGFYCTGTQWNHTDNYVDSETSQRHTTPWDGNARYSSSFSIFSADADGNPFWHILYVGDTNSGRGRGSGRAGGINYGLFGPSVQVFNSATILLPIQCSLYRDSSLQAPIGRVKDTREVNMQLLTDRTILTLGTDEWQLFPLQTRRDPAIADDRPNSGWFGLAYKRIP